MSFNLGQAAAGFKPGAFGSNADLGAFNLGSAATEGFGGNSAKGGFLSGLAGRFADFFNNDTTQAIGVASTLGNFGLEAANRYNEASRVAALNTQTAIGDDFLDQYNAAKLAQDLAINPAQRQRNLMGVIPQLANSIAYSTGSPDSGFQSAARAARLLA